VAHWQQAAMGRAPASPVPPQASQLLELALLSRSAAKTNRLDAPTSEAINKTSAKGRHRIRMSSNRAGEVLNIM
jgi:hypothetical protein